MNSIRRGRRRPRVRSLSFRTFAWVLAREVALRVLKRHPLALEARSPERASLVSVPTETLARRVRLRLNWLSRRVVL